MALIIAGLFIYASVVGAAQSGPIPESEADRIQNDQALLAQPNIIGDDPDENGYTGPAPEATTKAGEPSEINTDGLPDNFLNLSGPDQQNWPGAVSASPDWTTYYYFFAAGSTFRPRDSGTGWDYISNGCISARGGNDIFTLHLEVPHGARIEYLRIFYYDTSALSSTAYITRYNAQGATDDLTSVASTGTGGYGTALSAYFEHIVDTANRAYILNWRPGAQGSTMRLCGLRVAYRLPS
jgi:hypothetical protein